MVLSPKALKPLFCSDSDVEELSSARLQCLIKCITPHIHHPISQLPPTPKLYCVRRDAKRSEIRANHIPFLTAKKLIHHGEKIVNVMLCLLFHFLDHKWLPQNYYSLKLSRETYCFIYNHICTLTTV